MEKDFLITKINRVIMVGKDEYTDRMHSFSRSLEYNELIFHFSGHVSVFFDGQILESTPNTIRFLPEGEFSRHDVMIRERSECIDVFFKADRPISDKAFVIKASQSERIAALFKKLFSIWVSKDEGYYFEAMSLLYKIFAEISKDSTAPKQHAVKIARALDMIHSGFLSSDLKLCDLARACNMGESYFQKLFSKVHGVSPKRYIIQLKINHACDLLRSERYSVTEIAEMCNFSDVYFFSRQFKAYMGITPTDFIQKYRSSK